MFDFGSENEIYLESQSFFYQSEDSTDDEVQDIFDRSHMTSSPENPRDSHSPFYWRSDEEDRNDFYDGVPKQILLEMKPEVFKIPSHVRNKHFMESPSIEEAEKITLDRKGRTGTNTVFEVTKQLYLGRIIRRSHNCLFQKENFLFILLEILGK